MADVSTQINRLLDYATQRKLIEPEDRVWAGNRVLEVLQLPSYTPEPFSDREVQDDDLPRILDALLSDAQERGILSEGSVAYRDLLDTAITGVLTPLPREVRAKFSQLRSQNPKDATDWFYDFSRDTNYIRRDRIAKDRHWVAQTPYGALDLSINLSKPEKDPRAIAAARTLSPSNYPTCVLCATNEGYAGRLDHPARQNHRVVPVEVAGAPWLLQYSPYVYYNEHCIVLSEKHTPMGVDRSLFTKLLDFVDQFPHYFVGSNADLPIVGGSILAHDHFQGGNYEFAMERAPMREEVTFDGYPDVTAEIVEWPMSVIRVRSSSADELVDLADKILTTWRGYSDEACFIFSETDGEPHNTITPIARRRGDEFELDLVLRNNITTSEHPLGVFHPHSELHHIKKENIGLIEVMGLAVLPARLKEEMEALAVGILNGDDLRKNEYTKKHADWAEVFAEKIREAAAASEEDSMSIAQSILEQEIGVVFTRVLEHAGVFKNDEDGQAGLRRFVGAVNVAE